MSERIDKHRRADVVAAFVVALGVTPSLIVEIKIALPGITVPR